MGFKVNVFIFSGECSFDAGLANPPLNNEFPSLGRVKLTEKQLQLLVKRIVITVVAVFFASRILTGTKAQIFGLFPHEYKPSNAT